MTTNRIFATIDTDNNYVIYTDLYDAVDKFKNQDKSETRIDAVVELNDNNDIVRFIISNNEFGCEVCPNCDETTLIKTEFRIQHCVECGEILKPCSLCNLDFCKCSECPLTKDNWNYLGGVKPKEK